MSKKILAAVLIVILLLPAVTSAGSLLFAPENGFDLFDAHREQAINGSVLFTDGQTDKGIHTLSEDCRYIVRFKQSVPLDRLETALSTVEYKPLSDTESRIFVISDSNGFIDKNTDIIDYYERDGIRQTLAVTDDPIETKAYGPLGIYDAWDIAKASSDVIVAVLDTGVDRSHEELAGASLLAGYDAVTGAIGVNEDTAGHGTGVIGIIAASANNSLGIAGVAHGVTVLPIKVSSSSTSIYSSDLINGIRFAADAGAKIINMSVGGYSYSYAEQEAVNYAVSKGCILISAAGNGGVLYGDQKSYPASYEGVISVASCDDAGVRSEFSQYNDAVDVAAYGENLNVIYREGDLSAYKTDSGTSFSCAIVSGIAALAASHIDDGARFTGDEFLSLIIDTCGTSRTDTHGYGIINAYDILSNVNMPIVSGVADGMTYYERVTIRFNRGSATLDGYPVENGETVISNGKHTLVVTDGGIEKKVTFRLKYDPLSYDFKQFANYAYFEFDRGSATLDGRPYASGEHITDSGMHRFVITDGDETLEKQINLKYSIPEVFGIEDGATYSHPVNIQIVGVGDAELNGSPVYGETTVAQSGDYTLAVYNGNGTTVKEYNFTVEFDEAAVFEGDYALGKSALDEQNGFFCLYGDSLVGVRIYDLATPDTYLHFLPVGRVYSHAFDGDRLLLFGDEGITVIDRGLALEGAVSVTETILLDGADVYAYGDGVIYAFVGNEVYAYDAETAEFLPIAQIETDLPFDLALYSDGRFCLSSEGNSLVTVLDCESLETYTFDVSDALLGKPRLFEEGYYSVGNRLYDVENGDLALTFCSDFAVALIDGNLYTDNRIIDINSGKTLACFAFEVSSIAFGEDINCLFGVENIFATVDSHADGFYSLAAAEKTDVGFTSFTQLDSFRAEGFYDAYSSVLSVTASQDSIYMVLSDRNSLYSLDRETLGAQAVLDLLYQPTEVGCASGFITVCFDSAGAVYVAPEDSVDEGVYLYFANGCKNAFVADGRVFAVSNGRLMSVSFDGVLVDSGIESDGIRLDTARILSVHQRVLTALGFGFNTLDSGTAAAGNLFAGTRIAIGRTLYNLNTLLPVTTLDSDVIALGGDIAVLKNGVYDVEALESLGRHSIARPEAAYVDNGISVIVGGGVVSVVRYPDGSDLNQTPTIGGIAQDAIYIDTVNPTYGQGIGYLDGQAFASGGEVTGMGRHEFLLVLPFGRTVSVGFILETRIQAIEFLAESQLMSIGETISLGVRYLPDGASSVPVRFACDSDGLYVDATGKVTALAVGTYTVTATVETDYGSFEAECEIVVSDSLIAFPPESGLTVNRSLGYLFGVAPSTKAEDLISMLSSRGGAVVANSKGEVITGFVGTGCKLILYDMDGSFSDQLTVVVVGDPDGDGYISAYDLYVIEHILRGAVYTEDCVLASDVVADGVITDSDRREMKDMLLGRTNPNPNSAYDNLFGSCTVQTVSRIESGSEIEVAVCINGSKYARGAMGNISYSGLEFLDASGIGWEMGYRNHGDSVSFYAFGGDGSVCGRAFKLLLKLRFRVTAEAGQSVTLSADNIQTSFENGCRNLRFEKAVYEVSKPSYGEFGIEIFNARDFVFDPDKREYSVFIPYNSALADMAITRNEDQNVAFSSLIVPDSGSSLITVRSIDADGTVKYYYIRVTREDEPDFATNCRLSTLEIEGFKLSPSFDPDVYSYSVTVPFETEKLNIYCVPQNSLEQVIVGDSTLNGENKTIEILVVSPDGESKVYTIAVIVEPYDDGSDDTSDSGSGVIGVYIWIFVVAAGITAFVLYRKSSARKLAQYDALTVASSNTEETVE